MRMQMRCWVILSCLLALAAWAPAAPADTTTAGDLRLTRVPDAATTFASPVHVASPPGDASRVFVVERSGRIRLIRDGVLRPAPFLDYTGLTEDGFSEQGLLSVAFAPDYATSGRFYVFYTDSRQCAGTTPPRPCDLQVDELRRSAADPDIADPTPVRPIATVGHRDATNHNGGQLAFGPDGALYAATGDGGGSGDPGDDGQTATSRLGKILRIDVSGAVNPATPPVLHLGLRNPFRFAFDHLTGDLLIGDVGQGAQEEVDFLPAGAGPANFGWNRCEGSIIYPPGSPPAACPHAALGFIAPALTYANAGQPECAVTGGFVSRDLSTPRLGGNYVYADFCRGILRAAIVGLGTASSDGPIGDPANPAGPPLQVNALSSFGEGADCRLYVASLNGPVYRLEATSGAPAACQTSPAPPGPGGGAGPPATADRLRPVISRLGATRRAFGISRATTAIAAASRVIPRGTIFRYRLSEPARVTLRFDRVLVGRRVGRLCLAATRARRARRACLRYAVAGTLRRGLASGARSVAFSGRIGRRPLHSGRYRVVFDATDRSGNRALRRYLFITLLRG